jgi:hypothetical protein
LASTGAVEPAASASASRNSSLAMNWSPRLSFLLGGLQQASQLGADHIALLLRAADQPWPVRPGS